MSPFVRSISQGLRRTSVRTVTVQSCNLIGSPAQIFQFLPGSLPITHRALAASLHKMLLCEASACDSAWLSARSQQGGLCTFGRHPTSKDAISSAGLLRLWWNCRLAYVKAGVTHSHVPDFKHHQELRLIIYSIDTID